jgi:glycosyltransferase involved in cell wall biosynthesis
MKKVVYVTSMPVPYREKIHEHVSDRLAGDYHVIYCHRREPNRQWKVETGAYSKSFLRQAAIAVDDRFIHVNPDVWSELNRLDPEIVITTGFNPTFLFAFMWCMLKNRQHISFTDGWLRSESNLTFVHGLVRKYVYRRSKAFIGPGRHSLDLLRHYGCPENALFQSHLCANNTLYEKFTQVTEKKYDIAFSGQFIKRKMPFFFAEVAVLLKRKRPEVRVLLMGDGPQREVVLNVLRANEISFHYAGFLSQSELPRYYAATKLFLFPTKLEPWGVVANEACAAGVPVITCENAGVGGDLVLHGYNGFVLELDAEIWCQHILDLLNDERRLRDFSQNALAKVQDYNYEAAARGIIAALNHCGVVEPSIDLKSLQSDK